MDKTEKKKLVILDMLNRSKKPLSSSDIAAQLESQGVEISERTVRLYLHSMDEEGLTENLGRKGRVITENGRREADDSRALERVGFLSSKIDSMSYQMDFDPAVRTGSVVINITIVRADKITPDRLALIEKVFEKGFSMGKKMALFRPGEQVGKSRIPEGHVGIGTVCSITFNGVLLRRGISTFSRFGGLLEIHNDKPQRFVEIINYDGTSIDPLEVFIRGGMADYLGAVNTGNGRIGASFREFPAQAMEQVSQIAKQLDILGLGSLMCIGNPGQDLYGIPVGPQRVGAIIIGGLNPVSIFEETGVRVQSRALSGLVDFNRLFHFSELQPRINDIIGSIEEPSKE